MADGIEPAQILQRYFGFSGFRGMQLEIIQRVVSGKHALVIMPTGMGKSLCYQIPALMHYHRADIPPAGNIPASRPAAGLTLVISPLIALMKDQVDSLRARGIDAAFINSSLKRQQREQRYENVRNGKYQILYVTPERFRKSEFLDVISQRRINLLAVDEAHCISQWGHDFRPDYTRIAEFRKLLHDPVTIALTATATPDVQADIVRQLGLADDQIKLYHEGIDRPNLRLDVEQVWGDDEKLAHILQAIASSDPRHGSAIIYFTLIRTLEAFSERLSERRVHHVVYHGDLPREQRRDIQNRFMDGGAPLALATNAFGMGVDKDDIRLVLHADIPGSIESYYQEIGRAGRDGLPSRCLLLYDEHDLTTQMQFIAWSNPSAEYYRRVHQLLINDSEQLHAFGLEWLREKLHHKDRGDFRLETTLQMLERHAVIDGGWNPMDLRVIGDLPEALGDQSRLDEKLRRDQQKLLALVQYVKCEGDRKGHIHEYFGLPYNPSNG